MVEIFRSMGIYYDGMAEYRELIRNHPLVNTQEKDCLIGCILNQEGKYRDKIYLVNTFENIAAFICSSKENKLVLIPDDYLVLNTIGEYVDLCSDRAFMNCLLPYLKKFQAEGAVIPDIKTLY